MKNKDGEPSFKHSIQKPERPSPASLRRLTHPPHHHLVVLSARRHPPAAPAPGLVEASVPEKLRKVPAQVLVMLPSCLDRLPRIAISSYAPLRPPPPQHAACLLLKQNKYRFRLLSTAIPLSQRKPSPTSISKRRRERIEGKKRETRQNCIFALLSRGSENLPRSCQSKRFGPAGFAVTKRALLLATDKCSGPYGKLARTVKLDVLGYNAAH